jgi:hypothetical protein
LEFLKSLLSTTVAVPLVSFDSLMRMNDHDATVVDNLMVEWIVMILFVGKPSSKLQLVYPLMLGKIVNDKVTDLFTSDSEYIVKSMQSVKPVATIEKLEELLNEIGIAYESSKLHELTVKSIVTKILAFNGISMWSAPDPSRLALYAANKSVDLINKVFDTNPTLDLGVQKDSIVTSSSDNNHHRSVSPTKIVESVNETNNIDNNAETNSSPTKLQLNPSDSVETWLESVKLSHCLKYFVDLEITTMSDLLRIKERSELELVQMFEGMKKYDVKTLSLKLKDL